MNQNQNNPLVKNENSKGFSSPGGSTNFTRRDSTIGNRPKDGLEASETQSIPGYTILETLGRGGMGHVFRANQERLDRIVALKVIRQDRQDTAAVNRFRKEARAAAKLSHPNIVVVHDFDQVGDNCFIAMEYVEGTDLYNLVNDHGPLTPRQACDYVRQVALGLQHAHERGMVHRDIKPANLLVAGIRPGQPLSESELQGTVKILDMGMALLHGADKDSIHGNPSGSIMGTPDYMAPEQAMDFRKVDIRADLYSLGCTFYFLLTGRPPFDEYPLMRKMMMHQTGTVRPVWEVRSTIPREIDDVVQKLLAKKPEERYQTPAELVEVLVSFLEGEKAAAKSGVHIAPAQSDEVGSKESPLSANRITIPEEAVNPPQPAPAVAESSPPSPPRPTRSPSRRKTVREEPVPVQEGPVPPAAVRNESKQAVARVPPPPRPVPQAAPEVPDEDEPDQASAQGQSVPRSPKRMTEFRGPAGGASSIAFGPKRDMIAIGGAEGALRLWEFDNPPRERIVLQTFETGVWSLVFSPDQRFVAWGSGSLDGLICLGDLTDPTLNHMILLHRHQARVNALAYSPDAKMLASGGMDQTVRWWELTEADGKEAAVLKGHKAEVTGVAFSPDAKTLASSSIDGTVRLWKRGGFFSNAKTVLDGNWGSVHSVAFAQLAPVLAFGCHDHSVRLYGMNGNSYKEAAVLSGHSAPVRLVSFPSDGKHLISICEKGEGILWDLATGAETHRWSLGGTGDLATGRNGLAITNDGRYVAIGAPEGGVTVLRLFSKKSK
jgi:serine/threonine protein kinase